MMLRAACFTLGIVLSPLATAQQTSLDCPDLDAFGATALAASNQAAVARSQQTVGTAQSMLNFDCILLNDSFSAFYSFPSLSDILQKAVAQACNYAAGQINQAAASVNKSLSSPLPYDLGSVSGGVDGGVGANSVTGSGGSNANTGRLSGGSGVTLGTGGAKTSGYLR
jgi:hypothetical protein